MSITVEFARSLIEKNECIVLYFEPVRILRCSSSADRFRLQNCSDVLNYPIGYTDLAIYDPDLDLVSDAPLDVVRR